MVIGPKVGSQEGVHTLTTEKICINLMLAFKAAKGMTPPYLQSLIEPYNPSRSLRSANTGKLLEPSLKTPGQRSTRPRLFSLLAPKLWNMLPIALRTAVSLPSFRRGLKTHLFRLHLSPQHSLLHLPAPKDHTYDFLVLIFIFHFYFHFIFYLSYLLVYSEQVLLILGYSFLHLML